MSDEEEDKPDPVMDHMARLMSGGRTEDEDFVNEGRLLFSLNITIALYRNMEPDYEQRVKFVERFLLIMQRKADQELAMHREMVESQPLVRMLGADPAALSEKTEQRFKMLRECLMELVK